MRVLVDAYSIAERRRVKYVGGRRAREGFTQSKRAAGSEIGRVKSGDFSSERESSEAMFEEPESTICTSWTVGGLNRPSSEWFAVGKFTGVSGQTNRAALFLGFYS